MRFSKKLPEDKCACKHIQSWHSLKADMDELQGLQEMSMKGIYSLLMFWTIHNTVNILHGTNDFVL